MSLPSRGAQSPTSAPANAYRPEQLAFLDRASRNATESHIVYAADHIVQVLNSHDIPYAIMGGFSLRIRGSPRRTFDVDLAVGSSMLQLRTAFAGDARVVLPLGPVSSVLRIFVSVGGPSHGGLAMVPVCVDLICEGSLGAPEIGNTLNGSEEVEGQTERGPRKYRLLDIQHLFIAKLAAFTARGDIGSNDFGDLMWLLTGPYGSRVGELSGATPLGQRRAFMATVEAMTPKLAAAQIQRLRACLCLA